MGNIITYVLYILTATLPFVFTIINSELFEFPKFILLLSGTLIISVAWGLDILFKPKSKAISHTKLSLVSLSIIAILFTQIIATLFSIHPYTSFWGYYGRFHGGLLTTICYTITYFAATKYLDSRSTRNIINISIYTAIILSLIAIFEHYNLSLTCILTSLIPHLKNATTPFVYTTSCWGQLTNPLDRSFATIGQPNWLAAYLIPHIFLILNNFYSSKGRTKKSTITNYVLCMMLIIAVIFTRSRSGMLALIISSLVYWGLTARQLGLQNVKKAIVVFFGSFALLYLLINPTLLAIPASPSSGTQLEVGGTDSGYIRKIVWSGTLNLIKNNPLLGTGPETFAYSYYWVKPKASNLTSEWDYLYNKAHNEYLNIAACSGILALLVYLYFHYAIFTSGKAVFSASIVAFFVTNFFGFSVISGYYLMILIAAFATTFDRSPLKPTATKPQIYLYWLIISSIALAYPVRLFLADTYFAKAKVNNSEQEMQKAIALRPKQDLYHTELAQIYAILGDPKKMEEEARVSRSLNPYHLNFYRSRARSYLILNQYDKVASELEQARILSPTDAKIAYNLGLIYIRLNNLAQAKKNIEDALSLKPNYTEAKDALSLFP